MYTMSINLTQGTSYFNTIVIFSILVNILDIFAVVCLWSGLDKVAKIETPLHLVAMFLGIADLTVEDIGKC